MEGLGVGVGVAGQQPVRAVRERVQPPLLQGQLLQGPQPRGRLEAPYAGQVGEEFACGCGRRVGGYAEGFGEFPAGGVGRAVGQEGEQGPDPHGHEDRAGVARRRLVRPSVR